MRLIRQPTLNFRNAQEEGRINVAIQRSVNMVDAVLDARELRRLRRLPDKVDAVLDAMELRRRLSISSTSSTLTELSVSSFEEPEWGAAIKGKPLTPLTPVHSNALNTTYNVSNQTMAASTIEVPNLTPLSETIGAVGHAPKKAPFSPSKKAKIRRRQKKKTSVVVTAPKQGLEHQHQLERMKAFMNMKSREKSRQARMLGKLGKQALERTIVVPFELEEFRASRGINFEPRVYRHEELAALGIRTIKWDGQ